MFAPSKAEEANSAAVVNHLRRDGVWRRLAAVFTTGSRILASPALMRAAQGLPPTCGGRRAIVGSSVTRRSGLV